MVLIHVNYGNFVHYLQSIISGDSYADIFTDIKSNKLFTNVEVYKEIDSPPASDRGLYFQKILIYNYKYK